MAASNDIDILRGKRILVAEDEYFIADEIGRSFESKGARVIGPVGTVHDALTLLERGLPVDGAVLDINLNGRNAFAVADVLLRRNVPFVFATGYDRQVIPTCYAAIPRFEKPVEPVEIARALFEFWT